MANPTIKNLVQSGSTLVLTATDNTTFTLPYAGPPVFPYDIGAGLGSIAAAIKGLGSAPAGGGVLTPDPTGGTSTPNPTPTPTPPAGLQAKIEVGPARAFTEPADAIPSLAPGGTIVLDDARYIKAFHIENEGATIKSASGNPYKCFFDGQGGMGKGHRLAWGKGMVHTSKSLTVDGVGFRLAGSIASGTSYSNEAGLWIGDNGASTPWVVTVRRSAFDNNANGIFTSAEPGLTLNTRENLFGKLGPNGNNASAGGAGVGPAHDMYVAPATLNHGPDNLHWGTCNGHNVKSRGDRTNVTGNVLTQDGGRVLDASDGGTVTFNGNTVFTRTDRTSISTNSLGENVKAGSFGNVNCIGYAGESGAKGAGGVTTAHNTFHISRQNTVIWMAQGRLTSDGTDTVNYYGSGSLSLQGNIVGLSEGSAPPGAPSAPPAFPPLPAWAQ